MKLILLLLLASPLPAAVLISTSTPVQVNIPQGSYVFIDEFQAEVLGSTVSCPTCPTVPVVPNAAVPASTGPVIMRSATSTDCYRIPYVNSNGTCGPTAWTACPK